MSQAAEALARATERTRRLAAVLDTLWRTKRLVMRERDLSRLLEGVAGCLAETLELAHAWVVVLDAAGQVTAWASAGLGADRVKLDELLRAGELPPCARRALADPGPREVCEGGGDCGTCALADRDAQPPVAVARLEHSGEVFGVLNASGLAGSELSPEVLDLVAEVATDLALAIHGHRAVRRRRVAETRLGLALEASGAGVYEHRVPIDASTFFSERWAEILGHPLDEVPTDRTVVRWLLEKVHPDDLEGLLE